MAYKQSNNKFVVEGSANCQFAFLSTDAFNEKPSAGCQRRNLTVCATVIAAFSGSLSNID